MRAALLRLLQTTLQVLARLNNALHQITVRVVGHRCIHVDHCAAHVAFFETCVRVAER